MAKLPIISILHTGGTISSAVDYRTGAVSPKFSPKDILSMYPGLKDIVSIKSRLVFQMFSEDMEPEHWLILAKEVVKEIKKGVDGIIITHGTDTLHYTSAALSFMLQDLPVPVLLVGAQRSPDRGSSDAELNLICASQFIAKSDFSGVGICMHGSMEDDYCYIHQGTKVRKLHSSRRDAFQSVNVLPYAKIKNDDSITFLRKDYTKKDAKRLVKPYIGFDSRVALLKGRPGLDPRELNFYKSKYKGIVLEGTGLGQIGVTVMDKYTKKHKKTLQTINSMNKKGIVVIMTSQTLFGKVNMNVYSTGRDLQKVGVIPGEDMLPEVAYVKLGWCLSQEKNKEKVKEMMKTNIAGEIAERIVPGQDSFDDVSS